MDGSGTALADPAVVFSPDEIELIAQHPKEPGIGDDVDGLGAPVDVQ